MLKIAHHSELRVAKNLARSPKNVLPVSAQSFVRDCKNTNITPTITNNVMASVLKFHDFEKALKKDFMVFVTARQTKTQVSLIS